MAKTKKGVAAIKKNPSNGARKKRGKKRRDPATQLRREKAFSLRLGGVSYREIGRALGVSHVAAWQYVGDILEETAERMSENVSKVRQMEIARLDQMVTRLWRRVGDGDQKAIEGMLRIMERRAKYLGLDAPTRIEGSLDMPETFTLEFSQIGPDLNQSGRLKKA